MSVSTSAGLDAGMSAGVDMRLGFCAANLGNLHAAMADVEAQAILSTAWNGGIRYFDTAPTSVSGCQNVGSGRSCAPSPARSS
jgi:hypothetical protein